MYHQTSMTTGKVAVTPIKKGFNGRLEYMGKKG